MSPNPEIIRRARPALLDAIQALDSMFAVERRLPVPAELGLVTRPPLSHCWAEALPLLKSFVENAAADWRPVVERLAAPPLNIPGLE